MLAAKNERHAVGATLLFNVFHYALRPWPWIIIALASLVVFPDLASIGAAFPDVDPDVVMVIASLIAALMSTLSTHLNWGSSYVVNDWYQRFIKPEASEKELVNVGRISTVVLMVFAAFLALALSNALQAFNILLQIGAGTGLIFILRWFWWRINAYTEIAGMFISFAVALFLEFAWAPLGLPELLDHEKLLLGVTITTIGWLAVTFMTEPTDRATLERFYTKIHPGGPGWQPVADKLPTGVTVNADENMALRVGAVFIGAIAVYSILFATGFYLYGNLSATLTSAVVAVLGVGFLWVNRRKL